MSIDIWQAQIKEAAARGGKICIRGSGSKSFCAPPVIQDALTLDTRVNAGIVEYEPNELVIVVRTGTPLAEVERVMATSPSSTKWTPSARSPSRKITSPSAYWRTTATSASGRLAV